MSDLEQHIAETKESLQRAIRSLSGDMHAGVATIATCFDRQAAILDRQERDLVNFLVLGVKGSADRKQELREMIRTFLSEPNELLAQEQLKGIEKEVFGLDHQD